MSSQSSLSVNAANSNEMKSVSLERLAIPNLNKTMEVFQLNNWALYEELSKIDSLKRMLNEISNSEFYHHYFNDKPLTTKKILISKCRREHQDYCLKINLGVLKPCGPIPLMANSFVRMMSNIPLFDAMMKKTKPRDDDFIYGVLHALPGCIVLSLLYLSVNSLIPIDRFDNSGRRIASSNPGLDNPLILRQSHDLIMQRLRNLTLRDLTITNLPTTILKFPFTPDADFFTQNFRSIPALINLIDNMKMVCYPSDSFFAPKAITKEYFLGVRARLTDCRIDKIEAFDDYPVFVIQCRQRSRLYLTECENRIILFSNSFCDDLNKENISAFNVRGIRL
jgi:hypothetical protein